MKPRGMIMYQGPSRLDGAPIVMIATLQTSNPKTGNTIQTWILRSDMPPLEASKRSLDGSICGDCPLKHSEGGECYVNIGQAPARVFEAYERGSYPEYKALQHAKYITGRTLRAGSYGDPAAVPHDVWNRMRAHADKTIGYTHTWRYSNPSEYSFCMASCDSLQDTIDAKALGWRSFRVQASPGDIGAVKGLETYCPAGRERPNGEKITCDDCKLCGGTQEGLEGKRSICIPAHGSYLAAGHPWRPRPRARIRQYTALSVSASAVNNSSAVRD